MTSNASLVISAIRKLTPRSGPESMLAEDVAAALRQAQIEISVESQLSRGRVDLRAGATAIELKVQGSPAKVLAQLRRYADDPTVVDVVLVTTSAKHRSLPSSVGGKPLRVVYLPRL